jgi:hypothetical protein
MLWKNLLNASYIDWIVAIGGPALAGASGHVLLSYALPIGIT